MLDQLRAIAGCDRPWAAERAAMALAIAEQYQGGGLDASEYQELMLDLARLDNIQLQAEDIELKTALVSAIYAVTQVV